MSDRGPDGEGSWAHDTVALAHRRLKIIDLTEAGRQPMVDPDLGLAVVFNGCIYNHRELRSELEGDGYRFFSTSDTEVILKAYDKWGRDCVTHFAGMFAFAVYEQRTGRLLLARDRLGVKPMYLAETRDSLRFASTLPALLAGGGIDTSIDPVALHHYLSWHAVVPPPRTILTGRPEAPAGDHAARGARRHPRPAALLARRFQPPGAVRRLVRDGLVRRDPRVAAHRRPAADGVRRPGRRAALGRP